MGSNRSRVTIITSCFILFSSMYAYRSEAVQVKSGLVSNGVGNSQGTIGGQPVSLSATLGLVVGISAGVDGSNDPIHLENGFWPALHRWQASALLEDQNLVPVHFVLHQNHPNPFNPTTRIRFEIPDAVHARVRIFDVRGRMVTTLQDGPMTPGRYEILFDGRKLASGVYFYQLVAGKFSEVRRMVLVK